MMKSYVQNCKHKSSQKLIQTLLPRLCYFVYLALKNPAYHILAMQSAIVYSVVTSYSDTLKNVWKVIVLNNYTKTSLKANSIYLKPRPSWQVG